MNQPLSVYILCGISGSGKSTWAETMAPKLNAVIVNMDAIRYELCYGNANDQSKNAEVYRKAIGLLEKHLGAGFSVIWDNTSKNPKSRKEVIEISKRFKAKAHAIYFKTDVLTAKIRNAARDRKVPDEIIDRQLATLVLPAFSEGFDEIQSMFPDNPSYRPTLL